MESKELKELQLRQQAGLELRQQYGPRKAPDTPLARFNLCIASVQTQQYLLQVLGRKKESFVNNITALVANDASLQGCSPMSLIYAGLKATALDFPLDNNLGFAYVIPYNKKKKITDENGVTREVVVKEAQLQWGYRAFIQLAIRTGQYKRINVTDVREGEIKSMDLLTGEIAFDAVPNRIELPVIGYAAYFELVNGFSKTLYMTVEELQRHAMSYSKTYSSKFESTRNSSKWTTDFDAMAKKTVIKLLLSKYAPLSVQMQEAVRTDQAIFDDNGRQEYSDAPDDQDRMQMEIEARKDEMRGSETAAPEMP